ncbi:MAG TPA: maleylpyruvate isomerase family mycothiol-dependent enzyme [Ilumatobacteraceae bacterium]|nr:maleylpyruvate isomerase family mycothiol-dependent enzyme [Ilumatobacteraceae bacterium]
MATTGPDHETLMWAESRAIADTLDGLDDASFDHATLCAGWRVRDVISHMLLGHTTPMPKMVLMLGKYGFNVPKASLKGSIDFGTEHSPAELRAAWRGVVDGKTRRGITKVIPTKEGFVDHMIHLQDILRPLGRSRAIPADHLTAALDVMPTLGGFVKSKQRMKGLRWRATDVDWTWGDGPEVVGPAEALILLASGRTAPLPEVSGDGVDTLRQRLAT